MDFSKNNTADQTSEFQVGQERVSQDKQAASAIAKKGGAGNMEILKVSSKSNPNSVAGALAGVLRERGAAEMQAIGAGAINQSVKAIAIARGFVAPSGMDLICIPAFTEIMIDGEERTAIRLIVEPR